MKIACVLITHLRAKAEMQRYPHLETQPVIIADRTKSKPVAVDYLPAATAVSMGMPLEQALSLQSEAMVLDADEPHYRRVFRQTLAALQGISDRVEDGGMGVAYVALDGLESMYGGEERLVLALLNAVPQSLGPRAGVGEGKFAAMVAARSSEPQGATRVPPDAAAFLSRRPVALLPVSGSTISALQRFGLHTLGQVAAMDVDRLVNQFGRAGEWIWNLANGRDDRPLLALGHEEAITEETSLPFASTSLEMLGIASDTLLRRAYSRPVMRGRYAGRAELECPVFGGPPWEKAVNFQESVGQWERAAFIVRSRLEAEPPGVPVDGMALTLSGFTGESGAQPALLPDMRDDRRRQLMETERRLQTRQATIGRSARQHTPGLPKLGDGAAEPLRRPALYRVVEVAPWHPAPEMRAIQTPLDPLGGELRTLLSPEPVSVKEDQDGLPLAVKSGDHWHRIEKVEESWAFDLWWLPNPLTRNYYRVERENGAQLTLFRDQRQGCWFQQGH